MPGALPKPNEPSFLAYWARLRDRLDREMVQSVPDMFGDLPAGQAEAIHRTLEAGKRIRGCLICLVCESLGGEVEAAVSKAIGIECIQAASLIHDDYVDGDRMRRDRPAEWTLQGSRQAVLLGDVMFATTISRMVDEGRDEGRLVAELIATMAKGAYQEHLERVNLHRLGGNDADHTEIYERIILLKTGSLFATAARLGAIAAHAPAAMEAQAFEFGARLGEAFQIADDLVDVIGLAKSQPKREAAILATASTLLRFSHLKPSDLPTCLDDREWRDWAARELPLIETRLRTEIRARCDTALLALEHFPENRHTDLLYEMPGEIVGAMEAAATAPRANSTRGSRSIKFQTGPHSRRRPSTSKNCILGSPWLDAHQCRSHLVIGYS